MAQKILYWSAILLSGIALILFMANTALVSRNQALQSSVSQRQTTIELFTVLNPLNQNLAQALAQSSIKNHDDALRELLSSQGISINTEAPKAAAPTMAPAPEAPAAKNEKK